MQAFNLLGTGLKLPGKPISSAIMDQRAGKRPGTSVKQSGVEQRYHGEDTSLSKMAAGACQQALQQAGAKLEDIDLIISASVSKEMVLPSTAAHIQQQLGPEAYGIPCFDIDSSCISFLTAFDISIAFFQANRYRRILIVSSEISYRHTRPDDTKTFALFGDGAAACLLELNTTDNPVKFLASRFETFSELVDKCTIKGGISALPAMNYNCDTHDDFMFQMSGSILFKTAASLLPPFLDKILAQANLSRQDIDHLIIHEASGAAMKLMLKRLGLSHCTKTTVLPTHGNMIAASIPTALHYALLNKEITANKTVLMIGSGAGLGLGAILLQF